MDKGLWMVGDEVLGTHTSRDPAVDWRDKKILPKKKKKKKVE